MKTNKLMNEMTKQEVVELEKTYYEDGKIESICETVNGVKHGGFLFYDESGQLLTNGKYKNGEQHGIWIYYDDDGDHIHELAAYDSGKVIDMIFFE